MTKEEFEHHFFVVVEQTDAPYLEARQRILNMGSQATPWLEQKRGSSANWKNTLGVEILNGWLNERSKFELCKTYVKGNLPGRPPITGKFTAVQRAKAIANLRVSVTPCLLEMLLKTHDQTKPEENAAIFGALARLGDKRSVEPLLHLLGPGNAEEMRLSAAGVLGQLQDSRAIAPLLSIVRDRAQPEALRATAALSLGLWLRPCCSVLGWSSLPSTLAAPTAIWLL